MPEPRNTSQERAPTPARGTVAVQSLGCKANQEEMECLLSRLSDAGYSVVPFGEPADWVVVNTCTVTLAGDSDSRQMIRRAAALKRDGRLVVTGCLAQRDPSTLAGIPGVDWVVGNGEKAGLARWMTEGPPGDQTPATGPWVRVGADPTVGEFAGFGGGRIGRRSRASLKVQDGCDEHCTFCVIPKVRGRSRSRPLDDVLEQAGRLVGSGYREICLTGINTALWGRDLPEAPELPELCARLARVPGLERIRLNSLEPQYVSSRWWDLFVENPRLCPHYHLPLQSGDAAVLRRMNRGYSPAHYAAIVERIHREMPEAAIGGDVLVGFPGETDEQFRNTERFLAGLPLAYLHVFSYSPRPGTSSLRLGSEVPVAARKERSARLRALDRQLRERFAASQIGSVQTVLPEAPVAAGEWQGITGNYLRVRFPWLRPEGEARSLPLVLLEGMEGARVRGRIVGPRRTAVESAVPR